MGAHDGGRCVRVGALHVPFGTARDWVTTYVAGDGAGDRASAYPAYDAYRADRRGDPLDEADLLAPVLLNVWRLSLDAYTWMVAQLPALNRALADIPLAADLANTPEDDVTRRLGALFSVLDARDRHGVRLTILSKVLHLKRPGFIPLWDVNVGKCYTAELSRDLARRADRPYADFAGVVAGAVRQDLQEGEVAWKELAALAPGVRVTPLRALDMVAWTLGHATGWACDPEQHPQA